MVSDSHVDDSLDKGKHGWMQRSEARRQIRAAPVDSESILDEIVGSDAEERHIVYEGVTTRASDKKGLTKR